MCSILLFGCRVLSCMLNIYLYTINVYRHISAMCSIAFHFQICIKSCGFWFGCHLQHKCADTLLELCERLLFLFLAISDMESSHFNVLIESHRLIQAHHIIIIIIIIGVQNGIYQMDGWATSMHIALNILNILTVYIQNMTAENAGQARLLEPYTMHAHIYSLLSNTLAVERDSFFALYARTRLEAEQREKKTHIFISMQTDNGKYGHISYCWTVSPLFVCGWLLQSQFKWVSVYVCVCVCTMYMRSQFHFSTKNSPIQHTHAQAQAHAGQNGQKQQQQQQQEEEVH